MKPDGRGVAFFSDGSFFEGRWTAGQQIHGRELAKNRKDMFSGSYLAGVKYTGYNVQFSQDGDRLDGLYLNGKKHGQFEFIDIRADGKSTRFVGEYVSDIKEG